MKAAWQVIAMVLVLIAGVGVIVTVLDAVDPGSGNKAIVGCAQHRGVGRVVKENGFVSYFACRDGYIVSVG